MQYGAHDASAIPAMSHIRGVDGRRWIIAACENKVTLHDLASSESLDLSRAGAFESKSPTRLAFLFLNSASLTGAMSSTSSTTAGSAGAAAPHLSPVLAVGVSSGAIYLVSPTSMTVFAKLSGAHRGAITALCPLGGETLGAPDRLVSTSADGTVAIWDPSRTTVRGSDREMAPVKSFKAHENGIKDASFFISYAGDKPEELPLCLATVGDDKKLGLWNVSNWGTLDKLQPLPKASCHSVKFAPWGGAGLGVHPSLIIASGESTILMGVNPSTKEIVPLIDLQGMIDPGFKKIPKVYQIGVHPTRPHLMAAATNTGVVLLTADPKEQPAVVALPAQVMTLEALMQASEAKEEQAAAASGAAASTAAPAGKGALGLTYVMATQGKLWSTALRMESRAKTGATERTVTLEASPREAIADLEQAGRPLLACSTSGRSISAVWPESRNYTVYSLAPTGTWDVVDRGSGNCLAWASTAPMYALISVANIPDFEVTTKKGLLSTLTSKFSSAAASAAAEEEAATVAAAARAAAAATTVQVHVVDESNAGQFVAAHDLALNGAQPVLLHGGALLGVVAIDPVTLQRALRFFSWRDFSPVGPALPEPLWVSWEPECTLVALGFEHTVELCRVHPNFERFATLSLAHAAAGIWQSRQLFVSTPSSLHLIFADPAQEFVQEVTLASFQGGAASKTAPSLDATPLPPEQMRPAGPVTLAGVRHSYLWLADAFGRPFLVSLRHPGLRLRCLAARGELTMARTIAERGLSAAFHDDVARFLAAMSPGDGVKEALLLPGLSPETEMALAIRDGSWDRAARCFQAFALGVSDKALLTLTAGKAASGVAGDNSGGVADSLAGLSLGRDHVAAVVEILREHASGRDVTNVDNDDEATTAATTAAASIKKASGDKESDSEEETDVPFVDPVDWDAPLSTLGQNFTDGVEGNNETTTTAGEEDSQNTGSAITSTSSAATEIVEPGELRRISAAAQLGLRFADAAADAGQMDAARAALGALVRYAPVLPASVLEDLVARMGRCRMTESTRNLAAAAASARPGSALQDPGVAALLAALTGGLQGDAVQATLHASGLAPLSAVYAAVWGQGNRDAAIERWKVQLADSSGVVQIAPPAAV